MLREGRVSIDRLRELLSSGGERTVRSMLAEAHPSEIAEIISRLDEEERFQLFSLLEGDKAVEVFEQLNPDLQREILDKLSTSRQVDLLEHMSADDRADLFEELSEEAFAKLLPLLRKEERRETVELMQFKPDTAGGLMTTEYAELKETMTVQQAIELLRSMADKKETIRYAYVTDKNGTLIGYVHLEDLIFAPPTAKIGEIMRTEVIAVGVDADQEEVARICRKYDLDVIPVVDGAGRLRGIITYDDVMDVIEEEAEEDIQRMGGLETIDVSYFRAPIPLLVRKRVVWLAVLLILEAISGSVLKAYSRSLEAVVGLAYFIPMLIGSGGNAGSQSAAMIIRELAIRGRLGAREIGLILYKELTSGLLLGLLLSFIAVFRAVLLVGKSVAMAATVGFALISVILIGTLSGALLPVLAHKLKFDPAVLSGPIVTTLVDVIGLVVYFEIAKLLLGIG
ncbi:magnesium transporter [Candidatus Poribacteria bacterium]|nr:MAG: magnesium transporter [Candidatus Poribacteria bacterium]